MQCPECAAAMQARTVSRRGLLAALGAGVAGVAGLSAASMRVAWADGPWQGDTLVVLSLRGGFDGLSAVAPVGDPDYGPLRPTIAVPVSQGIKIDSLFALHPSLAQLQSHWAAGRVAAVHAVGLPSPNRSHFAAMDEIERAAPGSGIRTGWLDRLLSLHDPNGPFGAVQLGSTSMPIAFDGPFDELGMYRLANFTLDGTYDAASRQVWRTALTQLHDRATSPLTDSTQTTLGALDTAAGLADYHPSVTYPDTGLGQTLRDVAQLIKANIGARVITVDEGDWDMHSGLGQVDNGWMSYKLTDLGGSIAAFLSDLGAARDRVTLVTISEFGRRAQENDSGGLDHGWGGVMLVAGDNVNGGMHGLWPGLADDLLVEGDLRATTDYRAVLADILTNRCGADHAAVSTVLPGWNGALLGVTVP